MSSDNKAFVRQFLETMDAMMVGKGSRELLRALMHEDHVFHFPLAPEPLGRDAHIGMNLDFASKFSNFQHIVQEQIAEGDKVVTRGTVRLTHTSEFNGIPPSGKTLEFGFINIMHIQDGKNREEWNEIDGLKFMRGLGAIPS